MSADPYWPLRFLWLWLGLGWSLVALTVIFSLLPAPPASVVVINDKLVHALIYLSLALWFAGIYRPARYAVLAGSLLLLGAGIEVLQAAGDERLGEWLDLAANAIGIGIGLGLARLRFAGWCQWVERYLFGVRHV